ncbi:hypothetical protein [Streptosporangium sp. OZ121]
MAAATHAWLHLCGVLTVGAWRRGAGCAGCRISVEHAEDVQQFKLSRVW